MDLVNIKLKMRVFITVFLLTTTLTTTCVTGFDLPDLGAVFNSFMEKTKAEAETGKERVKRQDPGIGDESQLPHLVQSARLPSKPNSDEINPRYMPTLGNGHLATTVFDDSLFLNGLYEGVGAESHRAAIPARVMTKAEIANEDVEERATRRYVLNAEEGYFMETIDCDFAYIEHKMYIHKHFIRLFVNDIYWRKKNDGYGGGKLRLTHPNFEDSDDIDFGERTSHKGHYQISGHTKTAEDGQRTQNVHVFWMDTLSDLGIGYGNSMEGNYTVIMAVDRQESNARGEFDEAIRIMEEWENGNYALFELHANAWRDTWARGRIEVEGDNQLAKITWLSQFYLLGSLPSVEGVYQAPQHNDFLYGVGRTSLAKGRVGQDYQGHVMWDNEIYILPALVMFHPELVKRALRYRSELSPAAAEIADQMGAEGVKFPFRSSFSGHEVSPSGCLECENKKYYTSATVAWAIRQYYSVTRDRDYLINTDYNGCDVSREIARFLASRMHYDPHTGRYSMGEMTGPDETYPNQVDNAFTLVASSLAIHWARYLACQCDRNERDEVPDEWIEMALYLDLPYDNVFRLHGQHTGFFDLENPRINQADTVMLTYPLNWNMSRDIMRHDLEYYESITNDQSPAMTWSFFTIGWKWVEEEQMMNTYFLKSYQDYLIQPFKVWTEFTETSQYDQELGSTNFLPGMGGFLQSLVYGFAGVRIRPESLEFHKPRPPPGCRVIRLVGLQYLGTNMTVTVEDHVVSIYVASVGEFELVLRRNDSSSVEESMNPGGYITIDRPEEGFFIYTNERDGCEHPRDYIYMPWGYSPFVDSAPVSHGVGLVVMGLAVLTSCLSWIRIS